MSRRSMVIGLVGIAASIILLIVVTLALTPQSSNAAFDTATRFMNAAGEGDDVTAFGLLDSTMQDYTRANCPDGSVAACVDEFTPPEWGGVVSAVFRRGSPDGEAWNVDLIATYERDRGFSGVCIYLRVEPDADDNWRIAGWAGFISCGDGRSRNMASNPETPNRAP